ncbi:MAG: hypothetical protein JSS41_04780 [Proteobacteria bacterium]|nr:hypothetical protein [Pseudomonadota bacterium]
MTEDDPTPARTLEQRVTDLELELEKAEEDLYRTDVLASTARILLTGMASYLVAKRLMDREEWVGAMRHNAMQATEPTRSHLLQGIDELDLLLRAFGAFAVKPPSRAN